MPAAGPCARSGSVRAEPAPTMVDTGMTDRFARPDALTARRLARLRRLAWVVDAALRLPGTRFRFGLNSLIGLPPGFGDAARSLLSLYFVVEAARLRAPRRLLGRMVLNIAVEAGLGAVPVLGDLLDVAW